MVIRVANFTIILVLISLKYFSCSISKAPRSSQVKVATLDFINDVVLPSKLQSLVDTNSIDIRQRFESEKQLLHIEVYKKSWHYPISRYLPKFIKKPIAKTGLRTYSSSGELMDGLITKLFGNTIENTTRIDYSSDPLSASASSITEKSQQSTSSTVATTNQRQFHSVAIFVYMWVNEKYRGYDFGDYLLTCAMDYSKLRGDEYMLLVHDDNGSGKLIQYYLNRGFLPIFDFIDKGMICKL